MNAIVVLQFYFLLLKPCGLESEKKKINPVTKYQQRPNSASFLLKCLGHCEHVFDYILTPLFVESPFIGMIQDPSGRLPVRPIVGYLL